MIGFLMQTRPVPASRAFGFAGLLVLFALAASAQQPKRPLNHKDYDGWRSIHNPVLSRDGKYLAYGLFPQDGDGQVVVREIATGKEFRQDAGAVPAAPPRMADDPEEPPQRGLRLSFTSDGRYLAAGTYPAKAETEKAKKEKKKPEEMPQGGMVVIDLATGAATRVEGVRSFQTPEKGGPWVAYLKVAAPAAPPAAAPSSRSGSRRREYGTEMILRNLAAGQERSFADVLEAAFAKDGKTLVYTVASRKEEENGVFAVTPGSNGAPAALVQGKGKYSKLTWDRDSRQIVFLAAGKLCRWDRKSAAAAELVTGSTAGLQKGYQVSENGSFTFSRDGARVFFGCGTPRPPASEAAAPGEDRVVADLWHWMDDFVQPMQKVRAARDRGSSYTAVFHLADNKFVQLANAAMRTVYPSDDGRFALGADDHLYRRLVDYDSTYADEYVIDTLTGARRKAVERYRGAGYGGGFHWSPDGRHILFYRDKNWHTIAVPDGGVTNITAGIKANFWEEQEDRPQAPSGYGTAGWTRDGRFAVVYDRHDVWQISADGKTAKNVTDGLGRRENLQFRVLRLERDDDPDAPRGLDPEKPLLLRAENLDTRDSGFWRDRLNAETPPQKLIMGARNYRATQKAREADVLLVTASTFYDYPDLSVSDSNFRDLRRVTDANPQKAGLIWGTGELVRYRNADGVPLSAALYKPENFDAKKKYPLIVYIYERLSQNVQQLRGPQAGPLHQHLLLREQRLPGADAGYRLHHRLAGAERAQVRAAGGAGGGG